MAVGDGGISLLGKSVEMAGLILGGSTTFVPLIARVGQIKLEASP